MKEQKSINKKCKQCGGNLIFEPNSQNLVCEKCLLSVDFEKQKEYEKHNYENIADNNIDNNNNGNLKCTSCGALVESKDINISSVCPYCGSALTMKEEIIGLKPDFVVPFAFDKKIAAEKFKLGIKKKWFLPNAFKKSPPMENIDGIYFPVFSFDEKTSSLYDGVLEEDETITNSQGQSHTITHTRHISGQKNIDHTDVLVESTNKLNQLELIEIEPYNLKGSFSFDNDFIRGYSVEYYTDKLSLCKNRADKIIDSSIRNSILSRYSYDRVRYLNISTTRSDEKFSYGILPAYKFSYKYKDKNYTTLVNGQTGRVGGGLPKSKAKITFFVLGILLAVAGFISLFILAR